MRAVRHPDVLNTESPSAAAWGDAATVLPWVLYGLFGDTGVLSRQFDSMRSWVDRIASLAGENHLWSGGFQYGDWLDPTAPPDKPGAGQANSDVVATAHLARSAEIVAEAAKVLERNEETARYAALAAATREAFAQKYVTESGRVFSDAPTCMRWPCSGRCFRSGGNGKPPGNGWPSLSASRIFASALGSSAHR